MLFSNPLALLCQKAGLDGLAEFPRSRGDTGSVLKKNDEKKKRKLYDCRTVLCYRQVQCGGEKGVL